MKLFRVTSIFSVIVLFFMALSFNSCRKESFIEDPSALLEFSADTILFDTVFTTLGSTTQVLKVYNRHSESIRISSIRIVGGEDSQFRMAVDGINGAYHENVEILPEDSMYIFVEVTVDPGNTNNPFVIEDQIEFVTNGSEQKVLLNAWGQDAHFHGGLGGITTLPCNTLNWSNDKPHVVYGILMVDTLCSLTIEPGTQIFVHSKSGIWINNGYFYVGQNGSPENRVVFQGDRLEEAYDDVPGQWGIQVDRFVDTGFGIEVASIVVGGIWIYQSPETLIDHTEIKNGTIGLQVDTSYDSGMDVSIKNTIITNMSAIGLLTQQARVYAENVLASNCGQACCALTIGGKYDFRHCTFANYWSDANRTSPAFILNNYYISSNVVYVRPLEQSSFYNCIMWGNNAELDDFSEFIVDLETPDGLLYDFHNCIVDSDENLSDDFSHWFGMSTIAPKFEAPFSSDFHPKALGGNSGNMIGLPVGVGQDLDGIARVLPSVGCYEWQP